MARGDTVIEGIVFTPADQDTLRLIRVEPYSARCTRLAERLCLSYNGAKKRLEHLRLQTCTSSVDELLEWVWRNGKAIDRALFGSGPPASAPPADPDAGADRAGPGDPEGRRDPGAPLGLSDVGCPVPAATSFGRRSAGRTWLPGLAPDLFRFRVANDNRPATNCLPQRGIDGEDMAPALKPWSNGASAGTNGLQSDSAADVCAIRAFRVADQQVGGGHLYPAVANYLQAEVGPRLLGTCDSTEGQSLFARAAALTDMAGWMAHDAGQDAIAGQHFDRALGFARVGDDVAVSAHILASMSHLARHRGHPEQAIQFAEIGRQALLGHPPQLELEAQLLAMQARGHAEMRQPRECVRILVEAEGVLQGDTDETSPWISRFDEGSLACEAARCMRALGDLSEAQRQAERFIALRPGDRTRSRAFGQLILVSVLVCQGNFDEACSLARNVLDATRALGSYPVVQQLVDLKPLLEPHRLNEVVGDFLLCLEAGLQERMWLCRRSGGEGGSRVTAPGRST